MPKKIYTGKVISNKMDKTVVVAVTRLFQHPIYKKTVKRITKLKAHDENNKCKVGDIVKIIETRPLSKEKKWMVID
ncbi:MAG: 30S ribosomal protein S17 [Nitrospirae bacterium]|nr:30S ribosomal protein S17 [Nitrospirota bacterium]